MALAERPYQRILVSEGAHGAAVLTLNNPARRNAIGSRMVSELLYALEDAAADDAVRSVVITGAGKAFCAGGDFADLGPYEDDTMPPKGDYADLLRTLLRYEKPLVARVNGHAMGGGLGILASCHFAIGARGAKLGTPEINVGLFPMMIMAVLRRLVPTRKLTRMMLLGERVEADEAAALGLLGEAVDAEALDGAVDAILEGLASKSPITLKLGLKAMADSEELGLDEALPLLNERLGACLATDDAREGLSAFLEKRKPVWTGR